MGLKTTQNTNNNKRRGKSYISNFCIDNLLLFITLTGLHLKSILITADIKEQGATRLNM